MTGVHLHRAVAGAQGPGGRGADGIGAQVLLEPAEQGVGGPRVEGGGVVGGLDGGQGPLQLPDVASERRQQRVVDEPVGVVLAPRDRTRPRLLGEPVPEVGGGVGQPQVDAARARSSRRSLPGSS